MTIDGMKCVRPRRGRAPESYNKTISSQKVKTIMYITYNYDDNYGACVLARVT